MGPQLPPPARQYGTRDLPVFNRWNCITRIRAAVIVAVFAVVVGSINPGTINLPGALGTCAFLASFSGGALALPERYRATLGFFLAQATVDVAAATAGIYTATSGAPALLLHAIYVVIIVPAALISVPVGLLIALISTGGHALLLGLESGFSPGTFVSVGFLVPVFLYLLCTQQSFFYGGHLAAKNRALATLYDQLAANEQRLAAEGRLSAAVAETARTLSATLDAAEPLVRLSDAICQRLGADWSAICVVDAAGRFRLRGVTGSGGDLTEIGRIDFPLSSWPGLAALSAQRIRELSESELARLPSIFTGGRPLTSGILAALYRDGRMVGFVAVGFGAPLGLAREWALNLLAGIAEHATVVLQNARLLEEVREAAAIKSEFVGAVSHELRSPLNVILGYLEMALDHALGPLTSQQGEALARTQRQAMALLEMITALLDLNRFEAGRLPVESAPVPVAPLLAEVIEQVPDGWRRPDVELRVDLDRAPHSIATDRGKLKTVVRNLVHNALKFTDTGHVTLAAEPAPGGGLMITVADTGRGIPVESLPHVFDMFRQGPGATGGGVGLGLHIVRRFVDALGGTVTAASASGYGSCFTVTLPDRVPGTAEPARAA
ncbi:MAG: GAF domain-containing sensor histidine kinase [Candidatus Binatia bacterium]